MGHTESKSAGRRRSGSTTEELNGLFELNVGDAVVSPWGPGHIVEKRATDYVVGVDMGFTKPVRCYLQPNVVRRHADVKQSGILPEGTTVKTPYGPGIVKKYRPMHMLYELSLAKMKMKGGHPSAVFRPGLLSKMSEEESIHCRVLTTLGAGALVRVRTHESGHVDYVVLIPLSCGSSIRAYLAHDQILNWDLPALSGETVTTPIGKGRVISYNERERAYSIEKDHNYILVPADSVQPLRDDPLAA
jgi:hypothetical protein